MSVDHYTYRVTWSPEDGEHVGLCAEFPSLSWLAETPEAALKGIRQVVADVVAEMQTTGEKIPSPIAEKHYSGEFRAGLARAVAERRAELWLAENRDALDSSNAYVEANGLPLARYRGF